MNSKLETTQGWERGLQSKVQYTASDMLEFAKWLAESGWTKHGNGYYYRSKDHNQWPADETCLEEDLLDAWRITRPLK